VLRRARAASSLVRAGTTVKGAASSIKKTSASPQRHESSTRTASRKLTGPELGFYIRNGIVRGGEELSLFLTSCAC